MSQTITGEEGEEEESIVGTSQIWANLILSSSINKNLLISCIVSS
jgi:hypothetical protein